MKSRLFQFLILFVVSVAVALFFMGCATVSNEVSLKKMLPQQRLYVGRMKVDFAGQKNPKCEIYINYDIVPSIKLSSDGLIFYKTDRQKVHLRRLACHHKGTQYLSAWHHQSIPLDGLTRSSEQEKIQYFGDIEVVWKIDPQATIAAAEKAPPASSPYREGQAHNSGEMKVTVSSHREEVESLVLSRWPEVRDKNWTVEESLVSLKK